MNITKIVIIIIVSLSVIFSAALITFEHVRPHLYQPNGLDTSTAEGTVEFITPESGTPYLIKRNEEGEISDERFKILTCTDMHCHYEDSEFTLTIFSRFLEKEKPDLVLLIGDNIVGRNDTVLQEKLINFFEERNQYWGFVLGNHDSEYKISQDIKDAQENGVLTVENEATINAEGRKWMFDSLSSGAHCIVRDEGGEGVFGSGNCVVNIRNSTGISQSLFFFDSGDYDTDENARRKGFVTEKRGYGYIRSNQLEWYKSRLAELTEENNGILPKSMAFFHIPLPEYQDAFSAVKRGNPVATRIYGTNYERACANYYNNDGAFDVFQSSGSTHTLVCGHDHKNDSCIVYKGVRLMYSQGLQYEGAYNRRKKTPFLKLLNKIDSRFCCFTEGVTLFMVQTDGNVDLAVKYAQKENVFYGLENIMTKHF